MKLTIARTTGIAVLASSRNSNTAFIAAGLLTAGDFATKFAAIESVVPARRDLLALKPTDDYYPVFYSSALYGKSWLDPSSKNTDDIFRNMVESVISGTMTVEGAIADANNKLNLLLSR